MPRKCKAMAWMFVCLAVGVAYRVNAQCVTQQLSCPARTVSGQLTTDDCQGHAGNGIYYFDAFMINGSAGDTIMLVANSNDFQPGVELDRQVDATTVVTAGGTWAPGNAARFSYTLTETGTWWVYVYTARLSTPPQTGSYTLSFTCGAPTALNLSNGRFRVSAHWATSDGASGEGKAVPLTEDTGYFWFFNDANVEMVVKVLNACSLNGRIWTFGAGLTNVDVTLTVTDTQTGRTRTYRNPQNTAFAPIQDTDAFSSCP